MSGSDVVATANLDEIDLDQKTWMFLASILVNVLTTIICSCNASQPRMIQDSAKIVIWTFIGNEIDKPRRVQNSPLTTKLLRNPDSSKLMAELRTESVIQSGFNLFSWQEQNCKSDE